MEKLLIKMMKSPAAILIATLVISAFFFWAMMGNTRMETDLDEYMPQDHPAFVYSDQAEELFGIQDGIIVAIENQNGIYNTATLDTLKQLTAALQKFEGINRDDVTSLYTADNITGSDFGLDVKPFFKRTPTTREQLEKLRLAVESNDMTYGRLVSADGTVAVVIAEIADDVFSQEFYDEILSLTKSFQTDEIKIHVAGRPIVEGTMALLGPADMKKMVPIVLLVILVVLYFTLRSIKSTLITMGVVFFSVLWAFGLMAMLNIPIYAVTTMMPVMLIAIGVADGIHLYSHLQLYLQKNPQATKKEAVSEMIGKMWKPVAMTSITTAVGFISLLTSEVLPIKYFGVFTAFGVMAAMLTESNVIGVVGPIETGDAKLYVDGFVAGVLSVDPSIDVRVTYIGSFSDVALASEAAATHIAAGADVLTPVSWISLSATAISSSPINSSISILAAPPP